MSGKTRIEATAEVKKVGQSVKQICYLHRASEQYPEKFEVWVDRDSAPYAPGFYQVDPDSLFLRNVERPGTGGRVFRDKELAFGRLLPLPVESVKPAQKAA